MKFEYYVLNYDWNQKKVIYFNVFQNIRVNEWSVKAVKKYLRAPSKYKFIKNHETKEAAIYGFKGLCEEIASIIRWQEWSRREYEISVSDAFIPEISDVLKDIDKYNSLEELKNELIKENKRTPKLEKWDCYKQCEPNIPMITREIIWQYRQQLKEEKS